MQIEPLKTKAMITIRKATLDDLEAIHTIERLSFDGGGYPLFVLRQLFDVSQDYFLVAEDKNEILGYSLGNLSAKLNQGWLLSLVVLPEARGRNIGKQLTEKLITLLEYNLCREICLTVHPYNIAAINIYKRLNFEIISAYDNYYFDKEERLLMIKKPASIFLNGHKREKSMPKSKLF